MNIKKVAGDIQEIAKELWNRHKNEILLAAAVVIGCKILFGKRQQQPVSIIFVDGRCRK